MTFKYQGDTILLSHASEVRLGKRGRVVLVGLAPITALAFEGVFVYLFIYLSMLVSGFMCDHLWPR